MANRRICALLVASCAAPLHAACPPSLVFSGIGGTSANGGAHTAQLNFETAIGGSNNGSGGSYANGFRAITWDGVGDSFATPNYLPNDYFNVNSPHGLLIDPVGAGVQVSADAASGYPVRFGNIDPTYTNLFTAYSSERLFAPIEYNLLEFEFRKPGTKLVATVRGFGAILTNVTLPSTTSLEFYTIEGQALCRYYPPVGGAADVEFLGVLFSDPRDEIARVTVMLGTNALGFDQAAGQDLVVMDDVAFAEPQADQLFVDGFE